MRKLLYSISTLFVMALLFTSCYAQNAYNNADFSIATASVRHLDDLQMTVWNIQVKGKAGSTTPVPAGQLNGAPVLGYVFPTSLKSSDVGFGVTEGIVALA